MVAKPIPPDPADLALFLDLGSSREGRVEKFDIDSLLGHTEHRVNVSTELPQGYEWFVPALVYTFVGLDCSLFKIFAAKSIGSGLDIPTVLFDQPVVDVEGVTLTHEWYRTVQGMEPRYMQQFKDFLETFSVKVPRRDKHFSFDLQELPFGNYRLWLLRPYDGSGGFIYADGAVRWGDENAR